MNKARKKAFDKKVKFRVRRLKPRITIEDGIEVVRPQCRIINIADGYCI